MISEGTQTGADPHKLDKIKNSAQQQVGQISVDLHRADAETGPGTTGRYRVLIVLAPTEPEDPALPRADAGKWTIVIRRGVAALIEDPIHCWIQRSADPESLRSGSRQSYFDDDAYEDTAFTPEGDLSEQDGKPEGHRKTFVRHFGSLNGLATGRTALVVGGYRLVGGFGSSPACERPALYSSAGVLPDAETTLAHETPPLLGGAAGSARLAKEAGQRILDVRPLAGFARHGRRRRAERVTVFRARYQRGRAIRRAAARGNVYHCH
ncbi:hypothetical protein ACVOMS_30130 [Bradyrhizobium guangxiense]